MNFIVGNGSSGFQQYGDEETGQRRRVIIRKNASLPQRGQRPEQPQQSRFDVTSRPSQQADLDLQSMVKGVSSVSSQVITLLQICFEVLDF